MNRILIITISFLIVFAWWSALTIGLSTDEFFHHINGSKRYNFLTSFGADKNFQLRNNQFYPGLYDTFSYAIGQIILLINKKFYVNNIDVVMHFVNVVFSTLSLFGLYVFSKKIFNKEIALISVLLTLLNPFFFGHMGMNSKDIIIFFSLIWFIYYFYLYCVEDEKIIKNLLLSSFFLGFGCGVRLTFLVVIFPAVACGFIYLLNKYKSNYLNLAKRLFPHILIAFFITIFLIFLCWPHIYVAIKNDNFFSFLFTIIKNTINWNEGPKIGLLNGEYYEVFNTPKSYFLYFIFYRLPIYFSIILIFSYYLVCFGKLKIKNEINDFNRKFQIINLIALFPILLVLILSASVYDNIRLFLFVIPLFSIIASFSLYQLLKTFNENFKNKISVFIILILFSFSFYRFITLTPYQYTYVNLMYPSFKKTVDKFEQDYWATSYKELVREMKSKYTITEVQSFRIADCFGGDGLLLYYLNKNFGVKKLYNTNERPLRATHIILTNRSFLDFNHPSISHLINDKGVVINEDLVKIIRTPGVKTTCFSYYDGEDQLVITRNGAKFSSLRKLND